MVKDMGSPWTRYVFNGWQLNTVFILHYMVTSTDHSYGGLRFISYPSTHKLNIVWENYLSLVAEALAPVIQQDHRTILMSSKSTPANLSWISIGRRSEE